MKKACGLFRGKSSRERGWVLKAKPGGHHTEETLKLCYGVTFQRWRALGGGEGSQRFLKITPTLGGGRGGGRGDGEGAIKEVQGDLRKPFVQGGVHSQKVGVRFYRENAEDEHKTWEGFTGNLQGPRAWGNSSHLQRVKGHMKNEVERGTYITLLIKWKNK